MPLELTPLNSLQRLLQISDQIAHILNAHRKTQQVFGHNAVRPLDAFTVLDKTLHSAQ